MPKKANNQTLPTLNNFLSDLYFGVVIIDHKNQVLLTNKIARKTLGSRTTSDRWRTVFEIAKITAKTKKHYINDYRKNNRVLRMRTQYIKINPAQPGLIAVSLRDATREWYEQRQNDILSYLTATFADPIPYQEWVKSVLNRIKVLLNTERVEMMLWIKEKKVLQVLVVTGDKKDTPAEIKLGESLPGKSAQRKELVTSENFKWAGKKYSLLSVPINIGDNLIGVLNIADKKNHFFSQQDISFYEIIANRLATNFEYKRLLDELKQEHNRLTAVVYNTDQGKVLLDENSRVVMANPAFASLIQKNWPNIKNQHIQELLPELSNLIQTNEIRIYNEVRLYGLEGQPWVGVYLAKIKTENGDNTVLTIRDITSEKNLENLKNDFISTATHELRTPLTAIMGYLAMLEDRGNLDEKQRLYAKRMERASNNLFDLVEDLLSVLRIDEKGPGIKLEKHKILPILQEVSHNLESKARHKKNKVKIPNKNFSVYADASSLQRVLLNLVENAIKYSPAGSIVKVKFTAPSNKKYLRVDVVDQGVGIPSREQEKIFTKFHRVHNPLSIEAGGTGLGLYITKKFIEQWGGEIWVSSKLGKGSTFSFTVPTTKNSLVANAQKSVRKD